MFEDYSSQPKKRKSKKSESPRGWATFDDIIRSLEDPLWKTISFKESYMRHFCNSDNPRHQTIHYRMKRDVKIWWIIYRSTQNNKPLQKAIKIALQRKVY